MKNIFSIISFKIIYIFYILFNCSQFIIYSKFILLDIYTQIDFHWLEQSLTRLHQHQKLSLLLTNVPLSDGISRNCINKLTYYKSLLCFRLITIEEFYKHSSREFTSLYIFHNGKFYNCIEVLPTKDEILLNRYLEEQEITQSNGSTPLNSAQQQLRPSNGTSPLSSAQQQLRPSNGTSSLSSAPVSYTHLTLPTM